MQHSQSDFAQRVRPLRPGFSIGTSGRVGTLGLVVTRRGGDAPLLLSSSHVLSGKPSSHAYDVYQPGGRDRSRGDAPVASTLCCIRPSRNAPNWTEAALARPHDACVVSALHPLGPIRRICSRLQVGQLLVKVGRTTGLVHGRVIAIDWSGFVRFRYGRGFFARQVLVRGEEPVSLHGDSGSVWLTEDGEAAALNFASFGRGVVSVSTPMVRIFDRLGIEIFQPKGN